MSLLLCPKPIRLGNKSVCFSVKVLPYLPIGPNPLSFLASLLLSNCLLFSRRGKNPGLKGSSAYPSACSIEPGAIVSHSPLYNFNAPSVIIDGLTNGPRTLSKAAIDN